MYATDNLKSLAARTSLTVSTLRTLAEDLGLTVTYSKTRRTWVLNADATTVRTFNDHVSA